MLDFDLTFPGSEVLEILNRKKTGRRLTGVRNNANIKFATYAEDNCCFLSRRSKGSSGARLVRFAAKKALDKCRVRIERLRDLGHELRRPEADLLRDGIYELRVRLGTLNYRMLYFFHGQLRRYWRTA